MNNNLEFENEDPSPDSIEGNHPRTNYGEGFTKKERMYSDEDMKLAFVTGALTDLFNTWNISDEDMAKEKFVNWFEQFKKK
jgi:hypothetical protein